MPESHVITGLVNKYAELNGQIDHHTKQIQQLNTDTKQLESVIKLFSPEFDLRSISPKRKNNPNRLFQPRECQRMVLDVLQTGEIVTTVEIANQLVARKGLSEADFPTVRNSALASLRQCLKQGRVIQHDRQGTNACWSIAR